MLHNGNSGQGVHIERDFHGTKSTNGAFHVKNSIHIQGSSRAIGPSKMQFKTPTTLYTNGLINGNALTTSLLARFETLD